MTGNLGGLAERYTLGLSSSGAVPQLILQFCCSTISEDQQEHLLCILSFQTEQLI